MWIVKFHYFMEAGEIKSQELDTYIRKRQTGIIEIEFQSILIPNINSVDYGRRIALT